MACLGTAGISFCIARKAAQATCVTTPEQPDHISSIQSSQAPPTGHILHCRG